MFLRRHRRLVEGETYEYWTLVKTIRTARGPRQEIVATLGKEPGLESRARHGWEEVADLLEGRAPAPVQGQLGQPLPVAPPPQWAQVDLRGVRVGCVRDFGQVYLALSLWRRLGLHTLLRDLIEPGREEVPWELTACILTLARFCGQKSELEVAGRWYADSALEDLLGVPFSQINDARLYRGLDVLHAHKDKLCAHLHQRYQSWFGVQFEFLLYDVTSTYFEGQARSNAKAARGYSRDQRPDCKQVNIGLVVTPEGLPIGYEIFAGNTADVATVEDMVTMMEQKYGQAKRIWVLDRGMISEDNIDFLRARQARYIVGTPKSQLKKFQAQLLDKQDWLEVQPGVEVKLVAHPDGGPGEQYLLCRSSARRQKEAAMIELQRQRLRTQLDKTHATLQRHPGQDPGKIERRIGRWLGRFPAAERLLEVIVQRDTQGPRLRTANHRARRTHRLGPTGSWRVFVAHQLSGERPGQTLAFLHATDPGRRRLSDQQKRFEPAPGFPSKDRTGRSAHPGVLPESGLVAHAGNVDARQKTGRLRAATDQGSRHRAELGRGVAGQRKSEPTNPGITSACGRAP